MDRARNVPLADFARTMREELSHDGDEAATDVAAHVEAERRACTCTYAAFASYAGGTGFDISRYDPACPEHGDDGEES